MKKKCATAHKAVPIFLFQSVPSQMRQSRIDKHVRVTRAVPNHALVRRVAPVLLATRLTSFFTPAPQDDARGASDAQSEPDALKGVSHKRPRDDDDVPHVLTMPPLEDALAWTDPHVLRMPPLHEAVRWMQTPGAAHLREPDYQRAWGSCTSDPALKRVRVTPPHFYNFGDARFVEQGAWAPAARRFYLHDDPFAGHAPHARRVRTVHDVDARLLHELVTLFPMPRYAFDPQRDAPEVPPARKQLQQRVPDPLRRLQLFFMPHAEQLRERPTTHGATTLSGMAGVDKFDDNVALHQRDAGDMGREAQRARDMQRMHHGCFFEEEACCVAAFVLDLLTLKCGIIPDARIAASRMSPDGLCLVPPWVAWNAWMLRAAPPLLHLMMEAKAPERGVYRSLNLPDDAHWPYAHHVPYNYRTQVTDQTRKTAMPGNLFNAYWKFDHTVPIQRVCGTNVFLVAEQMVTLVLRSDEYVRVALALRDAHQARVEAGDAPPGALKPGDVPFLPLRMLPVVHVRFFIVDPRAAARDAADPRGERAHQRVPRDPRRTWFDHYACACCQTTRSDVHIFRVPWDEVRWTQRTDENVGSHAPVGWPVDAAWPPLMGSHVQFYPDAVPVEMTMQQLDPQLFRAAHAQAGSEARHARAAARSARK
jgi:hypothetical protein